MVDAAAAARRRWGSLLERGTLVALVLVAAFAWGFAALYDEVREGCSVDFDRAVVLLFRNPADLTDPIGPGWLESGVVDLTALGGNFVVTFVTLAVAGFFLLARKPHAAAFVLIAVLGAACSASRRSSASTGRGRTWSRTASWSTPAASRAGTRPAPPPPT
jgi:undecaprenyl-diphosphatase